MHTLSKADKTWLAKAIDRLGYAPVIESLIVVARSEDPDGAPHELYSALHQTEKWEDPIVRQKTHAAIGPHRLESMKAVDGRRFISIVPGHVACTTRFIEHCLKTHIPSVSNNETYRRNTLADAAKSLDDAARKLEQLEKNGL